MESGRMELGRMESGRMNDVESRVGNFHGGGGEQQYTQGAREPVRLTERERGSNGQRGHKTTIDIPILSKREKKRGGLDSIGKNRRMVDRWVHG